MQKQWVKQLTASEWQPVPHFCGLLQVTRYKLQSPAVLVGKDGPVVDQRLTTEESIPVGGALGGPRRQLWRHLRRQPIRWGGRSKARWSWKCFTINGKPRPVGRPTGGKGSTGRQACSCCAPPWHRQCDSQVTSTKAEGSPIQGKLPNPKRGWVGWVQDSKWLTGAQSNHKCHTKYINRANKREKALAMRGCAVGQWLCMWEGARRAFLPTPSLDAGPIWRWASI